MNHLSTERSPYLAQHASNPVDWYPWGDAAFEAARRDDKPIFLSIGYSTCHWCHVMAHESFESASVAAVLNRSFVSIKVDREERPDVDRVYMAFVQATTGAGGWPLSAWLTPDLKPFYGGTYFPPAAQWGRPGFIDILTEIARAWRDERPRVMQSADTILTRLKSATTAGGPAPDRAPVAGQDAVRTGVEAFAQVFDARNGGFGGSPKFPRPAELLFLFNAWALVGDERAKAMALETLRAMAMGGLRDHLGGGFHRYSVDAEWRVPHFEKMLYDQAQLAIAYLEAAQVSHDPLYAAVAEDTLDYVLRDLTGPAGEFYSAEDADSPVPDGGRGPGGRGFSPGEHEDAPVGGRGFSPGDHSPGTHAHESREGAFYVWSAAEIDTLLGEDAPVARKRFGIEDEGNAPSDPHGEFRGMNLLYIAQSLEEVAARTGRTIEPVMQALLRTRARLAEARAARPRPHRDDKVITAWNGLMIAAMARAARQLVDSPRRGVWRLTAIGAAEFAYEHLWRPGERRLLRRSREGEAAIDAFCEDYACLAWGAIEVFQTTGDLRWLDWAEELTAIETERFFDADDGGWFSTTGGDPSVLLRLKEDYDGAEPSAASVTVRNLIRLAQLTGDAGYLARAERTLERYGQGLGQVVRVMPLMMANVALWHGRRSEIVLVGESGSADLVALERVAARHHAPWSVTVVRDPAAAPPARAPWLAAMTMHGGRATAYVCHDFACESPTTDPDALGRQIEDASAPRRIIL